MRAAAAPGLLGRDLFTTLLEDYSAIAGWRTLAKPASVGLATSIACRRRFVGGHGVIIESVFVSGVTVNTCGHKELFVERFDVGVMHAGVEAKRLAVGAGLYGHVRNRG